MPVKSNTTNIAISSIDMRQLTSGWTIWLVKERKCHGACFQGNPYGRPLYHFPLPTPAIQYWSAARNGLSDLEPAKCDLICLHLCNHNVSSLSSPMAILLQKFLTLLVEKKSCSIWLVVANEMEDIK